MDLWCFNPTHGATISHLPEDVITRGSPGELVPLPLVRVSRMRPGYKLGASDDHFRGRGLFWRDAILAAQMAADRTNTLYVASVRRQQHGRMIRLPGAKPGMEVKRFYSLFPGECGFAFDLVLYSNTAVFCLTMEPSVDSLFGDWMSKVCNKLLCDLGLF